MSRAQEERNAKEINLLHELSALNRELESKLSDLISIRNGQFSVNQYDNNHNRNRDKQITDLDTDSFIDKNTIKLTKECNEIKKEIESSINYLLIEE